MTWQEEYKRKLVSAEEAVKVIESGDRVVIPAITDPLTLETALIARKGELSDVKVQVDVPTRELPWYEPGWEDSFDVKAWYLHYPPVRKLFRENRGDIRVCLPSLFFKHEIDGRPGARGADVVLVEVSSPDEHGFCSFGPVLWAKKQHVLKARIAIGEVHPEFIRTYGDNFIHVSEIDYFVEATYPPVMSWPPLDPEPHTRPIAEYVSSLIRNGDTIEIGAGSTSETLPFVGLFDNKCDLGWHTERIPRGCLKVMRERDDLFTGRYKTLDRGRSVATALALTEGDAEYVHNNPMFELYSPDYIHDIKVLAALDNLVAINNALSVDLSGQTSSEALGPLTWNGAGGLVEFAIGSLFSRGGRSVIVLPATARGGSVSRIVPMLELGTFVTVPRHLVDYVVTEYGIAKLLGKTQRERAEELINIAHPDFRTELKKEAKRLYWP
ncbi:acetyl-CoA hydrolase/transferase family protein [Chloroflexota bacterium]